VNDDKDTAFPVDAQRGIEVELTELRQRRDRMTADFEGDRDTVGDSGDAADAIQRADEGAVLSDRIAELTLILEGGKPTSETAGELPDGTELTLRFSGSPDAVSRASPVRYVDFHPAQIARLNLRATIGSFGRRRCTSQHRSGRTRAALTPAHSEGMVIPHPV
jgi:transcription elongation GreA/GreB family factor